MKIKKTMLVLPILLSLLLLFAGCTSNKEKPAGSVTEFTYWTVNSVYEQYHLEKAKEWNVLHPDRQVRLKTRVFEGGHINDRLWTTLHSGILVSGYDTPDLVDIEYQDFDEYVSQSNCLLYPIFERASVEANKQFGAYIYRDLCFGIPYGMDKMVLYFNDVLLSDAGIDITKIKTWDDFLAAGRQYYLKTGNAFTAIDAGYYDFYITLLSQQDMDYNNTALGLKSEKSIASLDYMEQLMTGDAAELMPGGRADSNLFYTAFSQGEVAVFIDQLSSAAALSDRLPGMRGEIGITEIPQMRASDPSEVWVPSYATAITMSCDDYQLLKEFLEFARLSGASWQEMLKEMGSGLYFSEMQAEEALESAEFTYFFCNDILPLYINHLEKRTFLPNATTVSEWIDNYEYELAEGIFDA